MNITKQNKIPEIICLCVFIICTTFLCFYHEPWYDEVQAFNISKASLYDIFFTIPHLEGHPPLWYLILKPFSMFNITPEMGLQIPNLLLMFAAVWLILFKSPFKRPVNCILPFTYFIFYQYSVISRPYSIYCFAMFLAALFYKERNEHPFKFILPLVLLCSSCTFGMVMAAGIIIVWFIEIIRSRISAAGFLKDKRFLAMFIIFLVCLSLLFIIIPDEEVIFEKRFSGLIVVKTLYVFFILPLDSLFTNYCYSVPGMKDINLLLCVLGICTYVFLFKILKAYNSLLLFCIPYIMFLLCAYKYMEVHHIGLLTVFYIFVWWCSLYNKQNFDNKYNKIFKIFVIFTICIQLYWSIAAFILDYKNDYWFGKSIAEFIKENNLQNYNLMSEFKVISYYKNKNSGKTITTDINIPEENYNLFMQNYERHDDLYFNQNAVAASINTYFGTNIFKNFNINRKQDEIYIKMKLMDSKETENNIEFLRQLGLPEFYIGNLKILQYIYPEDEIKDVYYDVVKAEYFCRLFKDRCKKAIMPVFIRSDINEKLKLPVEENLL